MEKNREKLLPKAYVQQVCRPTTISFCLIESSTSVKLWQQRTEISQALNLSKSKLHTLEINAHNFHKYT